MNSPTERVAAHFDKVVADLELPDELPAEDRPDPGSQRRRKAFQPRDYSGLATLSLVDDNGVLQWVYEPPARGPSGRRRRRGALRAVGAQPVRQISFRETAPNQVIASLEELDEKLTPKRGLRRYRPAETGGPGTLEPVNGPLKIEGRVLLLVHGTFSKSDMFVEQFAAVPKPKGNFLDRASASDYDAILAFDHPTLSVSPWINALDLEEALSGVTGPIDVICHSRGGLVVAWWLRNAKRKVDNVIFVGSPLEGTSLAAPANLRSALQFLAGTFKALEATSAGLATILPFMAAVTGLAKVCGGILRLGASTPLADAAVVVVPGLAGQSRVGNNAELRCLHRPVWVSTPAFHAVVSNFEPADTDANWWEVWKHFANPKMKALDFGADVIFRDRLNDLVVDTESMTRICDGGIKFATQHDFLTSRNVHHCNYFQQPETVDYFCTVLKIP
jgi:pimeloyl-ACP methyl ester carboxylesterase